MHALITGGAGFIGSHLAVHLAMEGCQVTVLDDLSGGYRSNVPIKAGFSQRDIADQAFVQRVFHVCRNQGTPITHIFHLAAYAAEGLSHYARTYNYTNNLVGTANLITEAIRHKVAAFVFTSSMAVYGSQEPPFDEELRPAPEDPYGIAKYAIEMDLEAARKLFGLNYVIFRPHNVYGERQNLQDRYRNVVAIFVRQALNGEPLTIFGDGEQIRAFSYVGDIVPAIARSATLPEAYGQVFNIGGEVPMTINELACALESVLERRLERTYTPPRYEVQVAYCKHEKLRATFGGRAATDLMTGLRKMTQWAQGRERLTRPFNKIDLPELLPSFWQ